MLDDASSLETSSEVWKLCQISAIFSLALATGGAVEIVTRIPAGLALPKFVPRALRTALSKLWHGSPDVRDCGRAFRMMSLATAFWAVLFATTTVVGTGRVPDWYYALVMLLLAVLALTATRVGLSVWSVHMAAMEAWADQRQRAARCTCNAVGQDDRDAIPEEKGDGPPCASSTS